MSDTTEVLPRARSVLGIGTILRLLAIALGIMSATLIARDGFNVSLGGFIDAILVLYDDALTTVALVVFDPAIRALFAKIREWFVIDLQLLPHWKHVFVLLWLYCGSHLKVFERHPLVPWSLPREVLLRAIWYWFAFTWLLGGLCALVAGVVAGTMPLTNAGVFWWPVSLLLLFDASTSHSARPRRGLFAVVAACALAAVLAPVVPLLTHSSAFWWPLVAYYLILHLRGGFTVVRRQPGSIEGRIARFAWPPLVVAAIFAVLATRISPALNLIFERSLSPGLASLAVVVGIKGGYSLLRGASGYSETFVSDKWTDSGEARIGLDLLAVLGGAAFFVWLGHELA